MAPVNLEQWIALILGGGLFGSAVSWLTTRHRPKVDTAQMVLTGSDSLINNLQEERDRLDKRMDALSDRLDSAVVKAGNAERRAEIAEKNAEYLAADMAKITDHHLATVRGVAAGTIPPWLPVPPGQNWLTDDDYPPFVARHHDTGTPGVDPNPPPQED